MRKNRYVKIKGKTVWIENSISYLRSLKKEVEISLKGGKKMRGKLYYGMVKIFDSNTKRKYYLVVIKNNKGQRMFLTNKKVGNAKEAMEVIKVYSYRWLIEETYKYLKQEYNLEKIHLRSEVERLNNYYNILLSSIGLAMVGLEIVGAQVKEMILELRKEDCMGYKLKNIMYAWLEVVEYILHNGKFFRNRNQRNYLQNQQNSLFSLI
ncbi:transposase [Candidatus Vampirococcus lugosii]|nr:transposase [Candidatus Vampirococcus lugosii]